MSCHCGLAQELQVSYTTELQSDFKQGSNWVNLLRLNFTHSLSKHTILQAATISTARTRAESLADDFQTFSNIEEENHPLAFATLGIQQQFGHSSLFFGIRNLNEDYFTSPATCNSHDGPYKHRYTTEKVTTGLPEKKTYSGSARSKTEYSVSLH